MDDLIRRKDAYDSLLNGMVMTGYQSRALDCIAEYSIPAVDAVEVVRCKDCLHREKDNILYGIYCKCTKTHCYRPRDWFCADGQRREDGM